jgi:hypothetical protein
MWPDPNALLLACLLPAWRAGERRVRIEGPLCPTLLLNLRAAVAVVGFWYPELGEPPDVEGSGDQLLVRPPAGHALSLLSCGIDSLTVIRWHMLHIPPEHPDSIHGAVTMMKARDPSPSRAAFDGSLEAFWNRATPVAVDAGLELLPVRTNFWWLVKDGYFYDMKWHGALLSSLAALFSRRFRKVCVPSTYVVADLGPLGSHPMLDPLYSSAHFTVEHHGLAMSRIEKVALVADWPVGLDGVRVCQRDDEVWDRNCGTCEKCLRTMLALVAIGKLEECGAFDTDDLGPELLEPFLEYRMLQSLRDIEWYGGLIEPLRDRGRDDLVRALEQYVMTPEALSPDAHQ